jgi:hypothetical protein
VASKRAKVALQKKPCVRLDTSPICFDGATAPPFYTQSLNHRDTLKERVSLNGQWPVPGWHQ